jgi:hypothetical protein
MWPLLACSPDEPANRPRPDADASTFGLPPVTSALPTLTEPPPDDPPRCGGGLVLVTFTAPVLSGALLIDAFGAVQWAWTTDDPTIHVIRARPARDGDGVFVLVGDREVDNGDRGEILRLDANADLVSTTEVRDPHHDFVELPDGRLAWLAYEFSMPSDGATQQFLATDRVWAVPEGGGDAEVLFSTLADWTWLQRMDVPPEGQDGRSMPGYLDWGHGASLVWRDSDERLFLMWRFQDMMIAIGQDGVDWAWGTEYGDLRGSDSFVHAHVSEIWDGGALVFDNRRSDRSRLVEYTFDDERFEKVWEWRADTFEAGIGDVRRMPEACGSVLSSWPSQGRLVEVTGDGDERWSLTFGAAVERIEVLERPPFAE